MLLVVGANNLTRALIANVLSAFAAAADAKNKKEQEEGEPCGSIILDLSVNGSEIFWSMYKDGVRFVEDIIPAMSAINAKTLKKYLSPMGQDIALTLKNNNLEDLDIDKLLYLISMLEQNYKTLIINACDQISNKLFALAEKSKMILLTFLSDSLSTAAALNLGDKLLGQCQSGADILALKLELGQDFHCGQMLKSHPIFAKALSLDFNWQIQKVFMEPKQNYKNESENISQIFRQIIDRYHSGKFNQNFVDKSQQYFQNETVYKELVSNIHKHLLEEMKNFSEEIDSQKLKNIAKTKINEIIQKLELHIPLEISERLIKELCDDVAGLGVLEDFIGDAGITEIMVNGANSIYIERAGKIIECKQTFANEQNLKTVIERIVAQTGRHIDEASPIVDARLKDGSRVNAVIRPIALNGPALTIRKFLKNKLSIESLIDSGALSEGMAEFLKASVKLKKNMIISGGTGTGKTTLLNAVSTFIDESERIVTIEDSAELQLQQKHTIRLEGRPKSSENTGEISIRRLVVNALRMRPDRIIVGECRSGEALDMLQAMNTGHEGSMSTIHANSEHDAIGRLETMVLMSGAELPAAAIIHQIISAVDIIVQLKRYFDGSRRISSISTLEADDKNGYKILNVFEFKLAGIKNLKQEGQFQASGFIPEFIKTADLKGVHINEEVFL